jgi:Ni,Fe-hydrogenase I large subunit
MEVLSMAKVHLDPITRIEGHLSIEIDVQGGRVVDAKSKGDMFRGFEKILRGRNPVDANQITQRICGVCPVSHGLASSKCLDDAFNIQPNNNGRILRNLVLGANYLQSHIIHFYHLAALDFVDITKILEYTGGDSQLQAVKAWAQQELQAKQNDDKLGITAVSPFLPRYEGNYIEDKDTNIGAIKHYLEALEMRIRAHEMVTLFGGRAPHLIGLVPGGVTQVPTRDKISTFRSRLRELKTFTNETYIPDVLAVADGYRDYFNQGVYTKMLSYGVFASDNEYSNFMLPAGVLTGGTNVQDLNTEKIKEHVRYSRFSSGSKLHPLQGQTEANPNKGGAYTWLKAPRYEGHALEVGPLARVAVAYLKNNTAVKSEVDAVLKRFNANIDKVFSVLGRHAARAIECKLLCEEMENWLDALEVGGAPRNNYTIPDRGEGEGLTEAPRGALGHWIDVRDKKIHNYQCVVPTTWFCGPRDDNGVKGPVEQALIGTPIANNDNPIEAARIVRSFDPCIACAVHIVEGDKEIGKFRVC